MPIEETQSDDASSTKTIRVGGRPVEVHAVWLRDACQCDRCRRPTTNERLLDSTTIPLDLRILALERDADRVRARTSDGHEVVLDARWLDRHLSATDRRHAPAGDSVLWDAVTGGVTVMERAELESEDGVFRWLDALLRCGCVVLRGVRPRSSALRAVASLVGEIRATNYGVTWVVEADLEPVTAVESERRLLVHTDLPYREVAPGVQFLLASIVDVAGGETTLVDGYAVAEQLRSADPEAWRSLTTTEFSYPFVRDGVEIEGRAPIIGLRPDGSYHQIRRAPDLVGVPYLADANEAPALYSALRTWSAAVDDPSNECRVALQPGDLLAFDNHRLLHGRTAFELGARGRRRLIGCYLDIEDVRSRRAIAARAR